MANYRRPDLDYTASTALSELTTLFLTMAMQEKAAIGGREFEKEMLTTRLEAEESLAEKHMELNLLSQDYLSQRKRLSTLEDDFVLQGYQLPDSDKTSGFPLLTGTTIEAYETGLKDTFQKIEDINRERAIITAGKDFAAAQETLYGGIRKAGEEEAWKDFMLEGNIEFDPLKPEGQQFTGTEEMADWLNKLTPAQKSELKNENYRRAFLKERRTIEEAQAAAATGLSLEVNRTAMALNNLNADKAKIEIREGNYDAGMKRFNDADKVLEDMIFEAGKGVLSSLNMVTADGKYSINYLQMLEDPDEYVEIMEDFMIANPEVSEEILAIKDNFILSTSMGTDWTESVIRAQARAYEDFLEARQMENSLGEGDQALGIERLEKMPLSDKTKSRYVYLTKRIQQFKRAGIYGSGRNAVEMEAVLVNSYEVIKAKDKLSEDRLEADATYLSMIANKGYPIELDDFAPVYYEGMSAAGQEDLLKSLALLKSIKSADGDDPTDASLLVKSLTEKVGLLKSLGFTELNEYDDLVMQLSSATFDYNILAHQAKINEAVEGLNRMISEASRTTGISEEILMKQWKLKALEQIPWGGRKRQTGAGRTF